MAEIFSTAKPVVKDSMLLFDRVSKSLFSLKDRGGADMTWQEQILRKEEKKEADSNVKTSVQEVEPAFDIDALMRLKTANTYHAACIDTKRDSTTGLGFVDDSTTERLDEYTHEGFQQVINPIAEDYWTSGCGYLEVVRKGNEIAALYNLQSQYMRKKILNTEGDFIWRYRNPEGTDIFMVPFGKKEKLSSNSVTGQLFAGKNPDEISEVVTFFRGSTLSRHYGIPDWLSAVPAIELTTAILQHNYDFFNNRGVPEFLFLALGAKVDDPDWKALEKGLRATIGLGNAHKTMAVNLPSQSLKIQVEKLGAEAASPEVFGDLMDTLSFIIVSGHRVPPLLAGIQVAGKLGASNELPNAMAAFQSLVIGQAQTYFSSKLANTIGKELGLKSKAFEFKTILDFLNLDQMAALGSTRTPVGPADPRTAGKPKTDAAKPEQRSALVKELSDMTPEERGRAIGSSLASVWETISGTQDSGRAD